MTRFAEIPAKATGAELHAAIVAEARRRKMAPRKFAQPLSSDPSTWLDQLSRVEQPRAVTRERVIALLTDRLIPEGPRRRIVRSSAPRKVASSDEGAAPPVPAVLPYERRACSWCGVRSDLGCRHLGFPDRASA